MNHASEWMKLFDERAGRYRYKHKGSGVVCDTLVAIGKTFARTATQSLEKTVERLRHRRLKKSRA